MRAGEDLDNGGHPIAFDPRHDAGEPVPRGLRNDRPIPRLPPALAEQARDLVDVDDALPAARTSHAEPAVGLPPAERLDGYAEHLRRLTHPDARCRESVVRTHSHEEWANSHQMSRFRVACSSNRHVR